MRRVVTRLNRIIKAPLLIIFVTNGTETKKDMAVRTELFIVVNIKYGTTEEKN